MITFVLNRTACTPFVTIGTLTEETSGFKCATVERLSPSIGKPTQKSNRALPAGTYKMKLVMGYEGLYLKISAFGAMSDARIIGAEKPSKAPLGSICIGTRWLGTEMRDFVRAGEVIDKILNHFIDNGLVDSRGKYGEIELVIKEDEMVRIDGKDPDYTEEDEMDWDLLDEDGFGDEYDE